MRLPQLNEIPQTREIIDVFGGYNHNSRIGEGEFYDMKNLSSSNHPVLSPRSKRGLYKALNSPLGIIVKDGIGYIEGTEFYYNGMSTIGLGLSSDADPSKTMMVSMGAFVIIITKDANGNLLDKKWVNSGKVYETRDGIFMVYGDIEVSYTLKKGVISMCDEQGDRLDIKHIGFPVYEAEDGDLLLEQGNPSSIKRFSASTGQWVRVDSYIKVESTGIGSVFGVNDSVNIIQDYYTHTSALEGFKTIVKREDNYILYEGVLDYIEDIDVDADANTSLGDQSITFARQMPLMDYIIESGNRLWGCRYGLNNKGEMVNEIYASKLGDFKNWNSFQGISTDSYVVSLGTDGAFTGAITHLGYPIFFKENCMHKVYGNYPSNYQMQTTACRGVQKGSEKSLAIVNEVLYYKSRGGICAFDGSLPVEISSAFGEEHYSNAVGGCLGNKYYVSMTSDRESTDVEKAYKLFVYDTAKGLWHKEDNTYATAFCSFANNLFYIDDKDKAIKTIIGTDEKTVKWMAETGKIGTDSPDTKYISKLNIRVSLDVEATIIVYIKYNSTGDWQYIGKMVGSRLQSYTMPIKPRRCDHFQLRFEGNGEAKIFSICKTIERGGEA